jgi:hypothetical protein
MLLSSLVVRLLQTMDLDAGGREGGENSVLFADTSPPTPPTPAQDQWSTSYNHVLKTVFVETNT